MVPTVPIGWFFKRPTKIGSRIILSVGKKPISYLFRGPSQIITSYLYCLIIIRLSNPVIRRIGLSQVRQTCLTHLSVPFYFFTPILNPRVDWENQHLYTLMRFLKKMTNEIQ
jgi:hypothetical protein